MFAAGRKEQLVKIIFDSLALARRAARAPGAAGGGKENAAAAHAPAAAAAGKDAAAGSQAGGAVPVQQPLAA